MIMISSPAGQRLAKAGEMIEKSQVDPGGMTEEEATAVFLEFVDAATQVSAELIEMNHHTGLGD